MCIPETAAAGRNRSCTGCGILRSGCACSSLHELPALLCDTETVSTQRHTDDVENRRYSAAACGGSARQPASSAEIPQALAGGSFDKGQPAEFGRACVDLELPTYEDAMSNITTEVRL